MNDFFHGQVGLPLRQRNAATAAAWEQICSQADQEQGTQGRSHGCGFNRGHRVSYPGIRLHFREVRCGSFNARCPLKSQGEIEAAVCDGISAFQQEFMGRGPRDIHAHLVGSLLVVQLQGALTLAERQLIAPRHEPPLPNGLDGGERMAGAVNRNGHETDNVNGRALLKQVRAHMVATGRSRLESIVEKAVGVKLVSVHHDISTVTGEEILVFSLAEPPACRPKKKA